MARKIGQIVSERVQKEFIHEVWNESIKTAREKAMQEIFTKGDWEYCPSCREKDDVKTLFFFDPKDVMEIDGRKVLYHKCDKCGEELVGVVGIRQEGNPLLGVVYLPTVNVVLKSKLTGEDEKKPVHRSVPFTRRFPR